jgi:hypothetical protein
MGKVVICGDSFSIGIGCHDLKNEPYGSLLAKELGKDIVNYSKGSSTNLSILLQVQYAIEKNTDIDLVCIGVTSYNRVDWFPEEAESVHNTIHLSNVNYHQYPPYGKDTYPYLLENPMKDDPQYKGQMFTENYYGVVDYVDNVLTQKRGAGDYFAKFKKERPERMKLLRNFYAEIFDDQIQRQSDIGVIVMAHNLLKNKGINHLILTSDGEFTKYVSKENLVNVDWYVLSEKYPDDLKTLHTSDVGQRVVYENVLRKTKQNDWFNS